MNASDTVIVTGHDVTVVMPSDLPENSTVVVEQLEKEDLAVLSDYELVGKGIFVRINQAEGKHNLEISMPSHENAEEYIHLYYYDESSQK